MSVGIPHGFNDNFGPYAKDSVHAPAVFEKLRGFAPDTIRFIVDWDVVQNQKSLTNSPAYNFEYFNDLLAYINTQPKIKVLPLLQGVPHLIPETGPPPNNTRYKKRSGVNGDGIYAPLEPLWDDFGEFAVAVFDHFDIEVNKLTDKFSLIDAVEVWNEPNAAKNGRQYLDQPTFAGMVYGAAVAALDRNHNNAAEAKDMTVVSGGITFGDGWQKYINDTVTNACVPFDVGIHPYYFYSYMNPPAGSTAVASALAGINGHFTDAKQAVSNNLWVTEVGCSATNSATIPFSPTKQRDVLLACCGAGGIFESDPRCKGMFIHDLLHLALDDPTIASVGPGTSGYNVVKGTFGDPDPSLTYVEPTHTDLRNAWL